MCNKSAKGIHWTLGAVLSALVACGATRPLLAQTAPPDFKAAPDIYKVVAESEQYRLVEGTWKPGQRDEIHSHPRMMFYWVTDCSMRWYLPSGETRDLNVKAGHAGTQEPIASHSVQNVGASECKVIMVETK